MSGKHFGYDFADTCIDALTISGKPVFVFHDHQWALLLWSLLRKTLTTSPVLITFDAHTDLRPAFLGHGCNQVDRPMDVEEIQPWCKARCSEVDFTDTQSVAEAINKLRNDEHIDCALRTNIIDHAYVFLGVASGGDPLPKQRASIFGIGGCDDHERKSKARNLISDEYLVAELHKLPNPIGRYILDIDLDYFVSKSSLHQSNCAAFWELIRGAEIVTIAQESSCVRGGRIDGQLTSKYAEQQLMLHIANAM